MNSRNPELELPPHTPGCDDIKVAARNVFQASYAAAKAGDLDAQLCYLMQAAGDRESGLLLSEAEIAEYLTLAPQFVDGAFKRGDWRVVELLGFHVVDWAGLFMELEQWKDPAREYKAHELLLLGAEPDVAMRAPPMPDSAQEVQDSDAWAHEMYDKYFSSQPRLTEEPRTCSDRDTID